MKGGIRRQRRRVRRSSGRARAILKFNPNVVLAEREELFQGFDRVCVCNTFYELMDGADSVRTDGGARIVEYL